MDYTWFPHRLESEDHTRPWFCPTLVIFIFCTWFPHRLESEDHARPRFCPWAPVLNQAWVTSLLGPKLGGISVVLGHALLFERPSVRGAPSRDSFILRVADDVGNRARDISSVAFLGTLRELNATTLSFNINRRESCSIHAQILQFPPLVHHA